ncbi:hypothetical protein Bca4012_010934 [Brassica carinata]
MKIGRIWWTSVEIKLLGYRNGVSASKKGWAISIEIILIGSREAIGGERYACIKKEIFSQRAKGFSESLLTKRDNGLSNMVARRWRSRRRASRSQSLSSTTQV